MICFIFLSSQKILLLLLNMLFISPFFFIAALLANPQGGLATFLTLFPTTAFLTVALRWGFGTIPAWQLILSWLLLVTTAVCTMPTCLPGPGA